MSSPPDLPRPRVLLSVLDEHFSELDVLWERRETCVFDAGLDLEDLAEIERRAALHLDGLRVGQGHSVDRARGALEGKESSAATAAAFTLIALGREELYAEALRSLQAEEPAVGDGVRIALRHRAIPPTGAEELLRRLQNSGRATERACATDVLAFHRRPALGPVPPELLDHDDDSVRVLAIEAVGRLRGSWETDDLERQLASSSGRVRRAALETAARTGLADLLTICREAATREDPLPEALSFLGVIGGPAELPPLTSALANPQLADAALAALGAIGLGVAVAPVLEALREPSLAHSAAAAFLRITAAEDVDSDKELEPPEDLPEDEAAFWDEHIAVDPDLADAWWRTHAGQLDAGGRWQAGCEVSAEPLGAQFATLPLETRRDVYLRSCREAPSTTPDLELERSAIAQLEGTS